MREQYPAVVCDRELGNDFSDFDINPAELAWLMRRLGVREERIPFTTVEFFKPMLHEDNQAAADFYMLGVDVYEDEAGSVATAVALPRRAAGTEAFDEALGKSLSVNLCSEMARYAGLNSIRDNRHSHTPGNVEAACYGFLSFVSGYHIHELVSNVDSAPAKAAIILGATALMGATLRGISSIPSKKQIKKWEETKASIKDIDTNYEAYDLNNFVRVVSTR